MNNIPAWMMQCNGDDNTNIPEDACRKKSRAWVFTSQIFITPDANINPLVPLDVDNGVPGTELWFMNDCNSKVSLLLSGITCSYAH